MTKYFIKYRDHESVRHIVDKIKIKCIKYLEKRYMTYYFGIILDPKLKLQKLQNILRLMSRNVNIGYIDMHYSLVTKKFTQVFEAYE